MRLKAAKGGANTVYQLSHSLTFFLEMYVLAFGKKEVRLHSSSPEGHSVYRD